MKIIDCDSHFISPGIFDFVPAKFQDQLPKLVFDDKKTLTEVKIDADPIYPVDFEELALRALLPGGCSFDERIKDLEKLKVDFQLIAPQERLMRFNYTLEKNLAAAISHSYNLSVKNIMEQYPNKFFGPALLPMQDIDLAIKELNWAIENNFTSVYIAVPFDQKIKKNITWSMVDRIDEIYKICEENNVVIYIHLMMHYFYQNKMPDNIERILGGVPIRSYSIAVYDLLTCGIFDKYPKLQVVLAEVQSDACQAIKNLIIGYQKYPDLFKGKKHFSRYLKENMFFTIDIEMKESFNFLLNYIGSERLLFSTDYPHKDPGGINKWNDTDDLYAAGLSQTDLENIAFRNAEQLFRLNEKTLENLG
jgi:predicted TIM-barrel fold metal-dependent hydrolase